MLTVTVGATGGHGVAARRGLAVKTSAMHARLGSVAGAAIDRLEIFRMPPSSGAGQVGVAFHAGEPRVNRRCAGVFGDEDGYFVVPAVACKVRSGVTPEALLIVLGRRGACQQHEDRGD